MENAVKLIGELIVELADLFAARGGGVGIPLATRATVQHPPSRSCTLADYAAAKGLDVPFLESLGISEIRFQGAPAVRFPYLDEGGVKLCVRFRVSLDGDLRVRTKAGMKRVCTG